MAYALAGALITQLFGLLFYQKVTQIKLSIVKVTFMVATSVSFVFLTTDLMIDPFSVLAGLMLVAFLILLFQKTVHLTTLILSFFIIETVWLMTTGIVAVTVYHLLNVDVQELSMMFARALELFIYMLILRNQKMEKLVPTLAEKEVKCMVLALTVFLMMIFSFIYSVFGNLSHILSGELYDSSFSPMIFYLLLAMMMILAVVLVMNLRSEVRSYHEKLQLEQGKHQIIEDKLVIERDNLNLVSIVHKYAHHISTTVMMTDQIASKITGRDELNEDVLNAIHSLKQAASELSDEFMLDDLNANVMHLDFPKGWEYLETMLAQFGWAAQQKGIAFEVENKIDNWHQINMSQVQLGSLVKNLLSNALKELDQTDISGKQVIVCFYNHKAGVFVLEVMDNAHEFSMDVLLKLSERQNSTNGTGDGYAEIFEILDKLQASLMIEETAVMGFVHKKIMVVLDGNHKVAIRSNYRQKELDVAMVESLHFCK